MTAWTLDRVERLKALWREGTTAERIALELGAPITRSAVLGKVHRMGLSAGRPPRTAARPARAETNAANPMIERGAQARAAVEAPEASGVGRRSVLTVKRAECRWPLGDPGAPGFSLCGRRIDRGAFCATHASRAYRPTPALPDSLARLAGLT